MTPTEPNTEPAKPDTGAQAEPKSDSSMTPTEPNTEPAKPDTGAQAEPQTKPEPGTQPDTSAQASPGGNEPSAETDSGTQAEPSKEPGTEAEPQVDTDEPSFANRTTFHDQMQQRLDRIDVQLRALESKGDTESQSALADLKQRRDAVAAEIEGIDKQTEQGWVEYRTQVQDSLDGLERDLDKTANMP